MAWVVKPKLDYAGRGRYRTDGISIYKGDEELIEIPDGFETDLASVPRIFWAIVPPTGLYEDAAVLHDWNLTGGRGQISSNDADGLFRRTMREAEVQFILRWVMWAGVRWGALKNPLRREGWWRESVPVVFITLLVVLFALGGLALASEVVDWVTWWD